MLLIKNKWINIANNGPHRELLTKCDLNGDYQVGFPPHCSSHLPNYISSSISSKNQLYYRSTTARTISISILLFLAGNFPLCSCYSSGRTMEQLTQSLVGCCSPSVIVPKVFFCLNPTRYYFFHNYSDDWVK